jgi:pyruvate formate lyase activating enzyme
LSATPIGVLTKAREIAFAEGIKYVYIGNVPGLDAQNTICPKCKGIVVERKGFTIVQNYLAKGTCPNCGEKIPGVWE